MAGSQVARTDRAAQRELAEEAGRAAEAAAASLPTHDDATAYRRRLTAVLVKRGVATALERWSTDHTGGDKSGRWPETRAPGRWSGH